MIKRPTTVPKNDDSNFTAALFEKWKFKLSTFEYKEHEDTLSIEIYSSNVSHQTFLSDSNRCFVIEGSSRS